MHNCLINTVKYCLTNKEHTYILVDLIVSMNKECLFGVNENSKYCIIALDFNLFFKYDFQCL